MLFTGIDDLLAHADLGVSAWHEVDQVLAFYRLRASRRAWVW
jgi:hypothetical protein